MRVEDEELDDVILPAPQPRFSETPGRIRHAGPPRGSANHEVYVEQLGLSKEELARLRDEGVV